MLKTETLHQLIQSLQPSEKRHFKLEASLYEGEKNYLLLFEALDEMEEYEEAQLLQHEKVQAFASDLRMVQNYLYKKLLRSLRHQQEEEMIDVKINNLMAEAKILEQRGLFELSGELLKKTYKLASKYHRYPKLVDILLLEAKHVTNHTKKSLTSIIDELFQESQKVIDTILIQNQLHHLNHWLYSRLLTKRYHNTPEEREFIDSKIKNNPLLNTDSDSSFFVSYLKHNIWSSYYYMQQDLENAIVHYKKIIEIWDASPQMIKDNTRQYIINLSNLLNTYLIAKKFDQVSEVLKKLKELKLKSFNEDALVFQVYNFVNLLFYLNKKDYNSAVEFISEFKDQLPLYEKTMKQARLLGFYYNITIAYFLTQNYEKADEWLEKILSITRTDESRKDIQRFARILQLAIYYQLDNHEMLEYMIRSVYRNKLVKEDMQPFDKLILKYFKKLQKVVPHSSEAFDLFEALNSKLGELEEDQYMVTGYEAFKAWLDMILEKKKK